MVDGELHLFIFKKFFVGGWETGSVSVLVDEEIKTLNGMISITRC